MFSQPTGADVAGFGNSGPQRLPPAAGMWNVDLSVFKAFPVGRFRPEFRVRVANIFNHPNWGAPDTSFTSPLFLTWSPSSVDTTATLSTPGCSSDSGSSSDEGS